MRKKSVSEAVRYFINGGATTAVNYIVYIALTYASINYLAANSLAWVAAVLFAYGTNRFLVFHSTNSVGRELLSFVGMRFLTLLVENLLLFLCIQQMALPSLAAKLCVSVVTVCSNYAVCKCSIFRKGVVSNE